MEARDAMAVLKAGAGRDISQGTLSERPSSDPQ